MSEAPPTEGPLAGLTVVSVEQAVAAPFASCRLADSGARVIKVERPEGDFARSYDHVVHGESAYFAWLNRGKDSLLLDLTTQVDRERLARLIAGADVLIQNLKPGAADKLGFGSAAMRARHPALITCDIAGYGGDGPYAARKAYDLLIQAESGLAAITGAAEAPGRIGVSVCDIATGMNAYAAILAALIERRETGRGQAISVSLFDAMAEWMTVPLLHHDYGGAAPQRVGLNHPSIAPYGVYHTGVDREGGGPILIAIQNEREWAVLCERVLKRPELATDPRFARNVDRVANRAALDQEIEAVFEPAPRQTIIDRLLAADIAFGALNEVAGLSTHPHLRRVVVDSPTGLVSMPAPPARIAGRDPVYGPIPGLGSWTEDSDGNGDGETDVAAQ